MILNIQSFKGVGPINFGMTVDDVRNVLGKRYESFKRTPTSEYPCDHFESLGIFVYYKKTGVVEAIEFAFPAVVSFENLNLSGLSFYELKKLLIKKDTNLEVEVDSITSYKFGVGVYAPDADENPSLPVESIIAFENGYYD